MRFGRKLCGSLEVRPKSRKSLINVTPPDTNFRPKSPRKWDSGRASRWIDVEGNRVVVVQGTPGQISIFDKNSLALLNSFPFSGANIPESKSTVQVLGGKALIAAGTGGLQVLSINTGEVVGTVPVPTVSGLDSSVVVTNAVSADEKLVFMSNGEAGVYLAEAADKFEDTGSEDPQEITLLGKLQFDNLQSVNHVAYDQDIRFVVAGLGGLKIIEVH